MEPEIASSIKLQVLGALGGQDVHYGPSITDGSTPPQVGNDHLFPWDSSVHLYLDGWWLEIPSRGIKAQLMVTTSNHVLVNMADSGDDLEIEEHVVAAKRSHEDEDTCGGESGGTSGTVASIGSDAEVAPEKRRSRGAHHKPRRPGKSNPLAILHQRLALQSELRKL